jgi:sugar-specific transcriptional regulator TrmB
MKWYDNEIAKLEKQWNNMTAEQQEDNESLSNRIEALKNNRDTLEELVADYDELIYEKIPELQDEITEAAYTQIEIKLKAFKVEAELYLDMSEALSDLKDFKDQLIDAMSYSDLKYNGKDDGTPNPHNVEFEVNIGMLLIALFCHNYNS